MRVAFTRVSANRKTGPIPVSVTESRSCPTTCGLHDACYAKQGPLSLHWQAVDTERGTDWMAFCHAITWLPKGQLWRHNAAGDLPHVRGRIDAALMNQLIAANHGRRGFTYTHHAVLGSKPHHRANREIIREANQRGFTVNLSADNLKHADKLTDLDIGPVAVVVPHDEPVPRSTAQGRRVVQCPAEISERVTCANCALCARVSRHSIVAFSAHGPMKKTAANVARG